MIRKARVSDIDAIAEIYGRIHDAEGMTTGWIRGVYPVRATAEAALQRDDLFVLDEDGEIKAAAVINGEQVACYRGAAWKYAAEDDMVCVLHTLVVDPAQAGKGLGTRFAAYYEDYARARGCTVLRMDTNEKNLAARALYAKLGYREADVVPCDFNGIPDVRLVLLEKSVEPV